MQVGVGDAAAQLAVSAATLAVQVESVAVSVAAPALQHSCAPAALVAGADVPAQCTVQHCWSWGCLLMDVLRSPQRGDSTGAS